LLFNSLATSLLISPFTLNILHFCPSVPVVLLGRRFPGFRYDEHFVEVLATVFADPVVDDPQLLFGLDLYGIVGQEVGSSAKRAEVGFSHPFQ